MSVYNDGLSGVHAQPLWAVGFEMFFSVNNWSGVVLYHIFIGRNLSPMILLFTLLGLSFFSSSSSIIPVHLLSLAMIPFVMVWASYPFIFFSSSK